MYPKRVFSFKVWLLKQISNSVTCVSYLLLLVLNPVTYGKTPFFFLSLFLYIQEDLACKSCIVSIFQDKPFFLVLKYSCSATHVILFTLLSIECAFQCLQPYVWFMWVIFSSTHGFELWSLLSIILTAALGTRAIPFISCILLAK